MRPACLILLLSVTVLVTAYENEDTWAEEISEDEPPQEPYVEESTVHNLKKRHVNYNDPLQENVRVKRLCHDEHDSQQREKRSADHIRTPRQVHQYEVNENTEESAVPSSPPYEEMLAASAEHYHRLYAAPGASLPANYVKAEVSPGVKAPLGVHPVPFVNPNVYVAFNPHNVASVPRNFVRPAEKEKYVNVVGPHVGPKSFVPVAPVNLGPPVLVAVQSNVEVPVEGPVPISPEAALPRLQKLDGGDQFSAAGHIHKNRAHSHGRTHAHGGGLAHQGQHHNAKGGKSVKGFKQHQHSDKGAKGYKTDEKHRKEYEEAAGKKKQHRDHADHKGSHVEQAHGHKGAHFDEKKGHKKGHKTKGYHNKYHKDEFHKEHKFYDDYHKSGEHHRFGKFNAKHASNESGKKKAHHVNAGHDFVERGKKGYSNKGHLDSDHKGYKGKHGHEEHKEHHSQHGKKQAKDGGKEWGYAKKE